MNPKSVGIKPTLLALSLLLSSLTSQAFAQDAPALKACGADKALEKTPVGASALTEEGYKDALENPMLTVRVVKGMVLTKDLVSSRLTVLTDEDGKVKNIYCQ